jgi:crotonobetainyl-CoA:carnitine CoA-transferase CaiB-like acyl-CoA transferase
MNMTVALDGVRPEGSSGTGAGWQMLADLGADVIKIEKPGSGDDTRGFAPPFMPGTKGSAIGASGIWDEAAAEPRSRQGSP